jgi:hypothetical protein
MVSPSRALIVATTEHLSHECGIIGFWRFGLIVRRTGPLYELAEFVVG